MAVWDEAAKESRSLLLPDLGRSSTGYDAVAVTPSLIHYAEDRGQLVGDPVLRAGLYASKRTFRWMKRYIANRQPGTMSLDGRKISYREAGSDFLAAVLKAAAAEVGAGDEEIALTVPVEAFEHYQDWLSTVVADAARMPRFRFIDEPSAAALGYGAHIQSGSVYLVFDFGGGTLDVAIVLIEDEPRAGTGRRCRVLGKAGAELGGLTIDRWLFEEVLRQNARNEGDESVRQLSRTLLVECERAKERLSEHQRAEVGAVDPRTGAALLASFTRSDFEDLLDRHDFFPQINRTIARALNAAHERGYSPEQIDAVLVVGGSSQIPSVQRMLQRHFGPDKVMLDRPLDAVARGAAAFVAGVDFYDHIQHAYAIKYRSSTRGDYEYRTIVQSGTQYPTSAAVAEFAVSAAFNGQAQLHLAVYEISEQRARTGTPVVELVFDPFGAARLTPVTPDEDDRRAYFWMNEGQPTFLTADPPASEGERRFQVAFRIDGNKRLLLTARDLHTGRLTHRDYPVVKLT